MNMPFDGTAKRKYSETVPDSAKGGNVKRTPDLGGRDSRDFGSAVKKSGRMDSILLVQSLEERESFAENNPE